MLTENKSYTIEEAYEQFKGMIYHIIYRMIQNVPHNRKRYYKEEMLSLSLSLLIPVCQGYNPKVAKFSTYLGTSLYRHLNQWRKRERKKELNREHFLQKATEEDTVTKEDRNQRLKHTLSEDALYVCDLICDPPRNMLTFIPSESISAKSLPARRDYREGAKEYLRSIGWKLERVNKAFKEISTYFETQ